MTQRSICQPSWHLICSYLHALLRRRSILVNVQYEQLTAYWQTLR